MEYLFLNYETSKKLKEKGFDDPCLAWYNQNEVFIWKFVCDDEAVCTMDLFKHKVSAECVYAPMFQQVIDWLMEKHNINIGLNYFKIGDHSCWDYRLHYKDIHGQGNTYYEALTNAINDALNII